MNILVSCDNSVAIIRLGSGKATMLIKSIVDSDQQSPHRNYFCQ